MTTRHATVLVRFSCAGFHTTVQLPFCSSPLSCLFGSLLSWFLNGLRTNNILVKQLIDGRPVIGIDKGKLLVGNCRSMGLTAYDVSLETSPGRSELYLRR